MRRSRPVRVCAADENITAERFHRDFVSKRLPVLLKGFARDWPAVATWSPSFFAAELGGVVVELSSNNEEKETVPIDMEFIGRVRLPLTAQYKHLGPVMTPDCNK